MLTVRASTAPEYYLEGLHALYYLTGDAGVGRWYGDGAQVLGYQGEITPEQLRAAYAGLSPDGSTRLVQLPRGRQRQPAWDLTFSCPKSVSVLWSALDAPERHRIEDVVLRATKRAIDYIDAVALFTRRGKQGCRVEHAKGIYALCPHGTSRAQDPQLHIHALAINLCVRDDGTTGTIRSRDLYWHKMAAGAIFRLELAYLLQKEFGLSIIQDGWKFKVKGVPESLCDEQSKRRKVIETIAKAEGWTSPRILAELAIATREPKGTVSVSRCLPHWQETAKKHGFTREVAEALLAANQNRKADAKSVKRLAEKKRAFLKNTIASSVASLSSFKAYFPERDLIRVAASEAQASGVSATELIEAAKQGLRKFENQVLVDGSVYTHYSTRENVAAEKELLERARQEQDSVKHIVAEKIVTKAKRKVERALSKKLGADVEFTVDQNDSLRHITEEPGRVKIVQGYAGTGKTQMLQAAHLAWKEYGYHVIGTAVTGKAALGLKKTTGIESVTVEFLLRRLRPNLTVKEQAQLFAWHASQTAKSIYYEGFRAGRWMRNPLKEAFREAAKEAAKLVMGSPKERPRFPNCKLTSNSILVVDEAAMLPTKTLLAIKQECDTRYRYLGD